MADQEREILYLLGCLELRGDLGCRLIIANSFLDRHDDHMPFPLIRSRGKSSLADRLLD